MYNFWPFVCMCGISMLLVMFVHVFHQQHGNSPYTHKSLKIRHTQTTESLQTKQHSND